MTISDIENDTSNTIASENNELRHGDHASDIRGSEDQADNGQTAPRHGPDTIAAANKEMRQDIRSDEIRDDEEYLGEPLADKSDVTAPMHDADNPINDASKVPGVDPDKIEAMRDESRHAIDLSQGRLRDVNLTQGRSIIEAQFDDRGPATHLEPDAEQ
ncbi:hypothetical protein [Granulosicoccus antarcticus]|uniref:Uncharacterized protein n=1 Tax=Granulosicoccus antarcticus IMCC3135 TaxID=1192854 RepID=A0A2Z2PA63_9GAMM|nr:hypothetical protein [Granulosicoccus antarcticus]ASJ76774.1 hypothetical protein IMCC3135_33665 [Granulosicoccus antarcticus IMCC3135]